MSLLSATSGQCSSRTTTWSAIPGSGPSTAPSPKVGRGQELAPPGASRGRGDPPGWLCLSLPPLQRWTSGGSAAAGACPPAPRHQSHTDPKARGKPLRSGMGPAWHSPRHGMLPAPVWRPGQGGCREEMRWGTWNVSPRVTHPATPPGPLTKAKTTKKLESVDTTRSPRSSSECQALLPFPGDKHSHRFLPQTVPVRW